MNKEKWDYVQFVFLDFIGTYKRTNEIKNTRQCVFIVFPFDINKYYKNRTNAQSFINFFLYKSFVTC